MGAPIAITGLAKTFTSGATTIPSIDELAAGTMTANTGPSGSGKSTLLHLLDAIARADASTIHVGDLELTGLKRGNAA
jgi:putative ABC transport system ATP-binding protein